MIVKFVRNYQKCCTVQNGDHGARTGARGSFPEGEAKIELADERV